MLKKIRRFFEKKPDDILTRGNRKGHGFHLFTPHAVRNDNKNDKQLLIVIGSGIAASLGVILFAVLTIGATAEFKLLVTAMTVMGGMIGWDIVGRRLWEQRMVRKLDELCNRHDRLTREVARNRSDIAALKEGLGAMALSVEDQGKRLSPVDTTEGKMIENIVSQLGALGDKPRAQLETRYDKDILELEMAPPPAKPAPLSELDNELNPDFNKYTDTVIAELVRHAVRNDKIDMFMQPVVSLPQRKPRMHEVYARIRAGNGTYIPAERYLDMAQKEELLPTIDNLLLLRCLQMLRERRGDGSAPYILNIAAATLNDRGFMNDLVAFLSQNHKMASRIIFELPQEELEEQSEAIAPVIEGLSKLGVRFSMDRVRNRRINISLLKSLNIRFLKLDAHWLLTEGHSKTGFSRIVRMKKQLDAAGIDLIVERIEQEHVLRELLDYSIDYGQGYLFGKPDHSAAYRETKAAAAA